MLTGVGLLWGEGGRVMRRGKGRAAAASTAVPWQPLTEKGFPGNTLHRGCTRQSPRLWGCFRTAWAQRQIVTPLSRDHQGTHPPLRKPGHGLSTPPGGGGGAELGPWPVSQTHPPTHIVKIFLGQKMKIYCLSARRLEEGGSTVNQSVG